MNIVTQEINANFKSFPKSTPGDTVATIVREEFEDEGVKTGNITDVFVWVTGGPREYLFKVEYHKTVRYGGEVSREITFVYKPR